MHLLPIPILVASTLIAWPAQASELGTWEIDDSQGSENIWSDYSRVRPDLYPDAWNVKKLSALRGEEVMLKSGSGAMLRWVPSSQLNTLHEVFESIRKVSEINATLYITRGETPNAAAGKREGVNVVFVNFAMMDMVGEGEDLWAALLGHELAHLKLLHGEKQAKLNLPMAILKTLGQAVVADPLTNLASGLLLDGVTATFSRKDEKQSDYMGVIWATEANYDPYGAVYLHQRMSERSSKLYIPFMSTHPSGPERIKELDALASRLTGKSD